MLNNEAWGGGKGNWGAKPAAAAFQRSAKFSHGKYNDKDELILKFKSGIDNSTRIALNGVNTSIFTVYADKEGKCTYFKIKQGQNPNFVAAIPQILAVFQNNGYDMKRTKQSFNLIEDKIDVYPTSQEIKDHDIKIASNWEEILSQFNDPNIQSKLLAFQTTNAYCQMLLDKTGKHVLGDGGNRFYGSRLSKSNISEILAVNPDATFVTSAAQWRRWNCVVNNGAKGIIINKIEDVCPPPYLLDNYCMQNFGQKWADCLKKWGNGDSAVGYSCQNAHTVRGIVCRLNRIPQETYQEKVYDLSEVTYDPKLGPNGFLEVAQLANNITLDLNDKAKEIEIERARAEGREEPDFGKKQEGLAREDVTRFRDFMLKKCEKAKIPVDDSNGSTEDIIARAVFEYGKKYAYDSNTLAPSAQKTFANALVCAIAGSYNISSPRITAAASALQSKEGKDNIKDVAQAIQQCYSSLLNFSSMDENKNKMLNEMHIMNAEELQSYLFKLAGVGEGREEEIAENKNSFFNFLNRMNESGKENMLREFEGDDSMESEGMSAEDEWWNELSAKEKEEILIHEMGIDYEDLKSEIEEWYGYPDIANLSAEDYEELLDDIWKECDEESKMEVYDDHNSEDIFHNPNVPDDEQLPSLPRTINVDNLDEEDCVNNFIDKNFSK